MSILADDDIIAEFVAESRDHLNAIEPDLLAMEKEGASISQDVINRIFRAIHSIKGAAGFFGFEALKNLGHVMESVLMQLRDGKLVVTAALMDPLFGGIDRLKDMVDDVNGSNDIDIDSQLAALNAILNRGALRESIELLGSANLASFKLDAEVVESALRRGMKIYQFKVYLTRDIQQQWTSPMAFLNKVLSLGEWLDASLDLSSVAGLEECLSLDLAVSVLFTSSLDVAEACAALKIPQEQMQSLQSPQSLDAGATPAVVAAKSPGRQQKKKKGVPPSTIPSPVTEPVPAIAPLTVVPQIVPAPSPVEVKPIAVAPLKPVALTPVKAIAVIPVKAIDSPAELPVSARPSKDSSAETLRIRVDLLTHLMNLAGELVLGRNQLMRALAGEARESGLGAILQNINQVTTELQEGIMQTRMQPADAIFNRFPRIIRDMAKQLGKQIELEIQGSEVELDKSLVELLTDPLTHIIRNSADHAIEMPEERQRNGKDPLGHILLRAYHQDGHVNIAIQDDGKGIDPVKVGQKAVEKGLITQSKASQMTERELVNLIFAPGFSTMETVSELSGRGVGMDVVRSNTEKMGGSVEVETVVGKGTTILLRLPLTLAIIPSMIVGVGTQRFAIPQVHVVEFVSVQQSDLTKRIERVQDAEVLRLRDRLLPLIRLADLLKIVGNTSAAPNWREDSAAAGGFADFASDKDLHARQIPSSSNGYNVIVVQMGSNRFGIVVDELFNIEEIVVKPISVFAQNCKCFSGATILGDGHVIMILDVGGIVGLANLQFADLQAEQKRRLEAESQRAIVSASRRRPIILCTGAADEYLAVPQDSILRLEMFPSSSIQSVGDQEFVNYRGHGLPLIRLEKFLDVRPVSRDLKDIYVIIPKVHGDSKAPTAQGGIVISSIIDALEADVKLEPIDIHGPGVLGSAIFQGKLTLFLKPGEILEAAGLSKVAAL